MYKVEAEMTQLRKEALDRLFNDRTVRTSFGAHGMTWCLFCRKGSFKNVCCGFNKHSFYVRSILAREIAALALEEELRDER